jgi:hypothetical protein
MKKGLLAILIIFLLGCAPLILHIEPVPKTNPNVSINYELIDKLKTIAIFPLKNSDKSQTSGQLPYPWRKGIPIISYPYANDGDVISDRIASYLMKSFKFKIVDREYIKSIISEQQVQLSGLVEDRTAIKIGKIVGVDGILVGNVNECVLAYIYVTDDRGGIAEQIASVNVNFKIIHVETGSLLAVMNHKLSTKNLITNMVEMDYDIAITNRSIYRVVIPGLDIVIDKLIEDMLNPVIKAKK